MRLIIAITLFSSSALADLDLRCFNDCKQSYSYQLCTEKCSYGDHHEQRDYRYQSQQQYNPSNYGGWDGKYRYHR